MKFYRQGDVAIIAAPAGLKLGALIDREGGAVVLARGESTGHLHQIHYAGAELYTIPGSEDRFLRIMAASGVDLVHEEHETITLPPGDFVVRIQREYTSKDMKPARVVD